MLKVENWWAELQKPEQERLRRQLLALFCIVSVVVGFLYLRITFLAPLGGDDTINNPANYDGLMHQPLWKTITAEWKGILDALCLKNKRFFPFDFPGGWITSWFRGTLERYRFFILLLSGLDAVLAAIFLTKAANSRKLGLTYLAAMPLMFCIWSSIGGNALYCYEGLPQKALVPALLSGMCMLRWKESWKIHWAILAALFMFYSCGVYELGYAYLFFLIPIAGMKASGFWDFVKMGLPSLAGEVLAFGYHCASSWANPQAGTYDGIAVSFDAKKALLTWVQQMSAAFPLNGLLLTHTSITTFAFGDVLWSLLLAALVVAALLLKGRLPATTAAGLMGAGFLLLAVPAALIAVTTKYQNGDWVTWEHGYLPAAVGSYGVGILFVTMWVVIYGKISSRPIKAGVSLLLVVLLTLGGTYSRAATRERYAPEGYTYRLLGRAIQAGLTDPVQTKDTIVCNAGVWDGDVNSESWYFKHYSERELTAYFCETIQTNSIPAKQFESQSGNYFVCEVYKNYGGYELVWLGKAQGNSLSFVDDVTIYVDSSKIPDTAQVKYRVGTADGNTEEKAISLSELPRTENDQSGGYLVTLPEDHIVCEKIMIWP